MKEIATQFFSIWKEIKPLQRMIAVSILLCLSATLGYLIFKSSATKQVDLSNEEGHPPALALSSEGQRKGFELFDTNTWIKGEKELQVLEMRALKGQIERDLAGFDQIKSASVILDIAPGRSFGGTPYKTKASVILTLNAAASLTISQIRAITNHLAGAVHGLEPNMIAISDTTGKLYKVIDPEGEEDFISNAALLFEEHLEQKIEKLLSVLVGEEHFFSTVQAMVEKGDEEPRAFSVVVAIDQEYAAVIKEVETYLEHLFLGYEIPYYLLVDAIAFEKKTGLWIETKEGGGYGRLVLTGIVVLVALLSLYPLFRRYSKKKQEDTLFKMMTRVDIGKLAESIEGEDPEMIALMLSYLEPARAEELVASFSEDLQEEVLNHLSALEYDNY